MEFCNVCDWCIEKHCRCHLGYWQTPLYFLGTFECRVSLKLEKFGRFFLRHLPSINHQKVGTLGGSRPIFPNWNTLQLIVLTHLNSSAWEGGGRTDIDPTLAINWLCCLSDPRQTIVPWLLQQNNVRLSIKQDASLRISTTFNRLTCGANWARWRRRLSDDRWPSNTSVWANSFSAVRSVVWTRR